MSLLIQICRIINSISWTIVILLFFNDFGTWPRKHCYTTILLAQPCRDFKIKTKCQKTNVFVILILCICIFFLFSYALVLSVIFTESSPSTFVCEYSLLRWVCCFPIYICHIYFCFVWLGIRQIQAGRDIPNVILLKTW